MKTAHIFSINVLSGRIVRLGLEVLSCDECDAVFSSLANDEDISFVTGTVSLPAMSGVSIS